VFLAESSHAATDEAAAQSGKHSRAEAIPWMFSDIDTQ
jgi:hypothetical protein